MLGTSGVGGDEGKVDLCLQGRGEFHFRLLRGLFETLKGHLVFAQIDAVLLLELIDDPLDDLLVDVIPAEVSIPVGGFHLHDVVTNFEDGDIEGSSAEVKDGDHLVLLLVQTVGQSGGGRFVDDPSNVQPGDRSGILRRLPLGVVEIGGYGDHRVGHLLAEVGLGGVLELAKNLGGNLRGRVALSYKLDPSVVMGALDNLIRNQPGLLPYLVVTTSHETLYGENSVFRVCNGLSLGDLPDKNLSILSIGHNRRGEPRPLLVDDNRGISTFHDGNDGVRRSQIDADDLSHRQPPFRNKMFQVYSAIDILSSIFLYNT